MFLRRLRLCNKRLPADVDVVGFQDGIGARLLVAVILRISPHNNRFRFETCHLVELQLLLN